jgi:hypothetical protein
MLTSTFQAAMVHVDEWMTSSHNQFIQDYIPFFHDSCDAHAGKQFMEVFFTIWFHKFPEEAILYPGRPLSTLTADEREFLEWHKEKRKLVRVTLIVAVIVIIIIS